MRTLIGPTAIVLPFLAVVASISTACGGDADPSVTWTGTVDTLPDGRVAVVSESPTWTEAARPVFEEELRIGSMMGEGPEAFGQVGGLLLDEAGRIYVLEGQAQEIRVFGRDGGLINVAPSMRDGEFEAVLVRYTPDMELIDTLTIPRYEGDSEYFELVSDGGRMRASVPFGAGLSWDLDPGGYFWVAPNTATYEVSQIGLAGDTLLTIRRPSRPHPVTSAEVDSAVTTMAWFTEQGGKVDRSRFPSTKPALSQVFAPGDGHVYVVPVTDEFGSGYLSTSRVLDVFGPDGRYLGRLDLPEGLATSNPEPVIRGDQVLAVVRDELDVPYVVRYRLAPPGEVLREAVS